MEATQSARASIADACAAINIASVNATATASGLVAEGEELLTTLYGNPMCLALGCPRDINARWTLSSKVSFKVLQLFQLSQYNVDGMLYGETFIWTPSRLAIHT